MSQIDTIWRLQIGLALIPCIGLLYYRLTMPESRKFQQSVELSSSSSSSSSMRSLDKAGAEKNTTTPTPAANGERRASAIAADQIAADNAAAEKNKKVQMWAFLQYFRKPKNALALFGCAMSWVRMVSLNIETVHNANNRTKRCWSTSLSMGLM